MNAMPHTGKKIENYVFNYSDFLGNGNFSKCYKALNTKTGQVVAIKIVELNSLKSKKLEELLFSEIEILKELNHPNVLRCSEVFTSNRNCYIITELCNEGDLENRIKKQKITRMDIDNIIADVYKGLRYLGSKNIIHRDLKIANIFVNNGMAKIADFGFALRSNNQFKDLNIGSPLYMSPEGVIDCIYGPKTDVWAFGIMVYELFHEHTPFSYCQTQTELRNAVSKQIQWNQLKPDIPKQVKQVILACLEIRQDLRPSIQDLQKFSFLANILQRRDQQQTLLIRNKSPEKKALSTIFNKIEDSIQSVSSKQRLKIKSSLQVPTNLTYQKDERGQSSSKSNFDSFSVRMQSSDQSVFLDNRYKSPNRYESGSNLPIRRSTTFNETYLKVNQNHLLRPPPLLTHFSENPVKGQEKLKEQKRYLISTIINFKEMVSLLHYCRAIFKYLQLLQEYNNLATNSEKQNYSILGHFLFLIVDQAYNEIVSKKIKFEGEDSEMRQRKLQEVIEEYRKKYKKELRISTILESVPDHFRTQANLSKIINYLFKYINGQTLKFMQSKSNLYFIISYLLLVIYSSTKVLCQAFQCKNYHLFLKLKQIEDTLNKNKDSFTHQEYCQFRVKLGFPINSSQ